VYGGSEDDEAFIVRVTDDGNMVFGGNTLSFGAGDSDFWLVKVDREGEIIWEKAYGKSGEDRFCSLTQTRDGGFILTGLLDHCETLAIETKWVYQVMKIDENGEILWHKAILYKSFSEPWTVYTSSVDETEGGNYVVAITSEIDTTRGLDFHILKFDQKGNILWQRTYGGSADDSVKCIREVPDYGYIAAGKTYSFDVENTDSWIVKLFPNGECDPLDDTPSVSTVSIACETDDTSAIREKLPSTPWNPSVPSTVTDTDCTVRQQAP
jgi:hypothetical protein